eukprot:gene14904-biopygen14966
MAALGIDQHGIDTERVDFPLPPHAHVLGPAHAVEPVPGLEHHAFHAQAARRLTLLCQVLPAIADQHWRRAQYWLVAVADHQLQLRPAFGLGVVAPVFAVVFQQVISQHGDRRVFEDFLAQGLAANALLQQGEGLHRVLPHHDFAVDHRAIGQAVFQVMKLRKALGDQFFAPRPDPQAAFALDQLCADTVPLPFHLPVSRGAEQGIELLHRLGQAMGQEKRIRLPATLGVFVGRFGGNQLQVAFGRRTVRQVGVAHQPLGHAFAVQPGHGGQGAGDQQLRHTDPEAAGDQLDAEHQARLIQLCPQRGQAFCQFFWRQATQGQEFFFQPHGQTIVRGVGRFR